MSDTPGPAEFVPWHCRRGHRSRQRADALTVSCGKCSRDPSYTGTVEMRRADLFPNWPRSIEAPTKGSR